MVWGVLTALGCPVWARWANAGGRKCAPYSVYRTGQKGGGESAGFRRRETPRSMWRGAARGLKSKFAESASSQCPSGGLRRIRRTGTTWPNCNYILQSILLLNYDATYSFLSCKLQPSKPTALKLDALLQTALQPTAFETYSFATTCVLLLPCSFFYGFTALLLLHTACFYCILPASTAYCLLRLLLLLSPTSPAYFNCTCYLCCVVHNVCQSSLKGRLRGIAEHGTPRRAWVRFVGLLALPNKSSGTILRGFGWARCDAYHTS